MAEPYPDYDKEDIAIINQPTYEVYDPWGAEVIGVFYRESDAELFKKALKKRNRKGK